MRRRWRRRGTRRCRHLYRIHGVLVMKESTDVAGTLSTDSLFSDLGPQTSAWLHRIADTTSRVIPEKATTRPIPPEALDSHDAARPFLQSLQDWAGGHDRFLYAIILDQDFRGMDAAIAFSQLMKTRRSKGSAESRAFCRLNESHGESRCLYVGKSEEIHKRLKDHLGYSARKTYSLQLSHWAKSLDLPLNLYCAQYANNVEKDVLQALEDHLWDRLRPVLGRRGPR